MSTKKMNATPTKRTIDDVILVMPERHAAPGTVEPHARLPRVSVTKPLEQLKQDWAVINQQVVILLDQTEKTSSETGFELDEVSFALGINAKGQIGFLAGAEVGGEASITLTFKRKQ